MSVVAVFFCFAKGKDALADLPADVMELRKELACGVFAWEHRFARAPSAREVAKRIRGQGKCI